MALWDLTKKNVSVEICQQALWTEIWPKSEIDLEAKPMAKLYIPSIINI
jgi:hypothetical protein